MKHAFIGSKKKRDIAIVIATILERGRRYAATEIERIIRDNVKPTVLAQRGLAPDHIRRAMIENGYLERDARTNEAWVAQSFHGATDVHGPRIAVLRNRLSESPDDEGNCPECGQQLKSAALLNHYLKKHAGDEPCEQIVMKYFGW